MSKTLSGAATAVSERRERRARSFMPEHTAGTRPSPTRMKRALWSLGVVGPARYPRQSPKTLQFHPHPPRSPRLSISANIFFFTNFKNLLAEGGAHQDIPRPFSQDPVHPSVSEDL